MSKFTERLERTLQPILEARDPRQQLSAYHDMPYAIFRYDPDEEFALRKAVSLLATRLQNKGKRLTRIYLSECLTEALQSQAPLEEWFQIEKDVGLEETVQTMANVLSDIRPLVDLVAERMPADPDPLTDVVFITRTGSLFPVYRTFSLLEQLKGRVTVPTVLFYPGDLDGAAGLRFMGVMQPEHNYRPKIF
ncbi:BREX protein BrxB domain-containing protein [Microvirga tunisiensis]|jgi:hypothetical protein|uniref:DUF1788 domain-containing protein n=1 Tax=Microvirga tunisiensis TaxID=2108360 RepID=A0A5N7MJF5_9HYPH|nr:BREX protein BrxB domain-containing protein [Microvirga tunisiensis]MPR06290.1 DUF1788 domain-containing protein [Microvirga tunisiensis]MPR24076.1 DUF1788 domain-containing protein [Microvirga tunisiensis]